MSADNPRLRFTDDTTRVKVSGDLPFSGFGDSYAEEIGVYDKAVDSEPERIRQFIKEQEHLAPDDPRGVDLDREKLMKMYRSLIWIEHLLVPGERAYVRGQGRDPSEATADIPRRVDAIVTQPESDPSSRLARLKERLSGRKFMIADMAKSDAASDVYRRSIIALLPGAILTIGGLSAILAPWIG